MPRYQTTYPLPQPQRYKPPGPSQLESEAFSLARRFDGVDDVVRLAIGACNLTGAFTIAALCRANDNHIPDNLVVNHNSANSARIILSATEWGSDPGQLIGRPTLAITGLGINAPSETAAMSWGYLEGWVIAAACKAAGSATPRFHLYKDGTWNHADGTGALAGDPTTQAGGTIRIPAFSAVSFDPYDFAVVAEWNGTALSDGQVEALSVNRATSDWRSHAVPPSGLWQFNQPDTATAVTDLMGAGADQVAVTGTEVITTGPLGWTYEVNPVVEFGIPTLVQRPLVVA